MASSKLLKKLAKRKEELEKGSGGGFQYFIFKVGTVRMRHLSVGDEEPGVELITFFLTKELGGGMISPASFGEKCAFYEMYQKLSNSKKDADVELASKIKPKKKIGVPSILYEDLKGKKVDERNGAKLALCTNGQYQDLLALFLDDEQGDFTDKNEGYDIKHTRVGSGQFDTEYSMVPCKPTKLPAPYRKVTYNAEQMARDIMPSYEQTQEMLAKFMKGLSLDGGGTKKKKKKGLEEKRDLVKKKKKKKRDL